MAKPIACISLPPSWPERLSNNKVTLDTFLSAGSLKSQLRRANKNNCNFAIIIGDNELQSGKIIWKDLGEDGEQELLSVEELLNKYTNL